MHITRKLIVQISLIDNILSSLKKNHLQLTNYDKKGGSDLKKISHQSSLHAILLKLKIKFKCLKI